ncbi:MAG: 4Fe-4S dicluster domain-containing protein, partial [Deltaproteobacteria bacterium]|nr:4Fe-4S dicluster domain-containing protein [Deltaproteobacteria bacterium]
YLAASGTSKVTRGDLRLLDGYAAKNGARYCQHACNVCASSCPRGVEISEVLRTRMYAVDYRDAELARDDYAKLGTGASPCLSCDGSPCAGACPNGIPIAEFTRDTARRLG